MKFSIGFGPGEFSGVVLGLEMSVAFRTTESEYLAIIPDEHDSMSRVDWTGAKIASLNSHSTI